jgi:hypothetical protein
MPFSTVVFAPCLGSAEWSYLPICKQASGKFTVSSIAVNNTIPLNLDFDHFFKSSRLSVEENTKIIQNLSAILKSVGAINIKSAVHYHPASQEIIVFYTILNVEQDKVDTLTTTIASVCEKLVYDLATKKYTCDIKQENFIGLGFHNETSTAAVSGIDELQAYRAGAATEGVDATAPANASLGANGSLVAVQPQAGETQELQRINFEREPAQLKLLEKEQFQRAEERALEGLYAVSRPDRPQVVDAVTPEDQRQDLQILNQGKLILEIYKDLTPEERARIINILASDL